MATSYVRLDPKEQSPEIVTLREGMKARVVGQDAAIDAILSCYQTRQAGLSIPGQPIGNFFFLGPTGTGKTWVVEALAETLLGDKNSVLKIDCAEYQHSHEIAKLIGSPPGYLGHRETHPALSQEQLNRFQTEKVKVSFVLFDELEKASDAMQKLLLGILDRATLTLGDNKKVDFSNAMIFMTSNIGSSAVQTALAPAWGFSTGTSTKNSKLDTISSAALRRALSPELFNRLERSNIITFHPLSDESMKRIVDIQLEKLEAQVKKGIAAGGNAFFPPKLVFTPELRDYLRTEGFDVRYGARPLLHLIKEKLLVPFANLTGCGKIINVPEVKVTVENGEIVFWRGVSESESVIDSLDTIDKILKEANAA